ncbi:ABC transporter ATP-binding protein [Sphaerisporangium siamense]|uniref:Branched-chain amino acid transport system ATP-binding protein n=1 Tax=Sphaerisporangium siamense TaxID=795645 RepID=A0A7W7D4A9_9ACTN|nr:ABC transporter ATP-binding protein [Sphaerisporangium siamense]MBB4698541.1 branched-chain amino acid transport system ATP-binding protein [Sphaerisporangium siamense]GII85398.1 ABC transporter ATP-binding protein [Sphaerisporangium siamense]
MDLQLRDVSVARGGQPVVRDVTLTAGEGRVTVLLGPNGAGKTTLLEAVSGVVPAVKGEIELGGQVLTKWPRTRRARYGLAHVEQGRAVFGTLTTRENITLVGDPARAVELFPELERRLDVRAGLLSGGEQQMLVLARAILTGPAALLLDEMSLGLAPGIVRRLLPVIRGLADDGCAVLLVEQFAHAALALADTAYVMAHGTITYGGDPAPLRESDAALKRAYLGDDS